MRVMKVLAATLMVAAVLAMTVPSFAQGGRGQGGPGQGQGGPGGGGPGGGRGQGGPGGGGPGGGRGMMMNGGGPGMMMMGGQMGEELGITEAQQEQMRAAMQEMMEEMRASRDEGEELSQEDRMARMTEMREAMQQKVEGILTTEQVERSGQLRLQMEGTRALSRDEVAEDLGLSTEQKGQLEAIGERVRSQMEEMGQAMRDGDQTDREAARERFTALRERADQARMSVLTDDQKTQLEEMKGEPFEFQRQEPGQGRQGRQQGDFQYQREQREAPTTEGRNTGAFPRGGN
jgi:hypothetical protein